MNEEQRKTIEKLARTALRMLVRRHRRFWRLWGDELADDCTARVWRECERIRLVEGVSAYDDHERLARLVVHCAEQSRHQHGFPADLFSLDELAKIFNVHRSKVYRGKAYSYIAALKIAREIGIETNRKMKDCCDSV